MKKLARSPHNRKTLPRDVIEDVNRHLRKASQLTSIVAAAIEPNDLQGLDDEMRDGLADLICQASREIGLVKRAISDAWDKGGLPDRARTVRLVKGELR